MNTINRAAAVILLADSADHTQFREAARFTFTLRRQLTAPEFTEAAREEIFEELTWNPTTDWAWDYRRAGHRGMRTGDIVELDGVQWMCDAYGWVRSRSRRSTTAHRIWRTLWPAVPQRCTPTARRHGLGSFLRSIR